MPVSLQQAESLEPRRRAAWESTPPRPGRSWAAPPGVWRQRSNEAHLEISAKLHQRTQRMSRPSQTCSSTVTGSRGEPGCAGAPAAPSARPLERRVACQQFVLYACFQAGEAKGNLQVRRPRAKPPQLSAQLLAAPRRPCPAPPRRPDVALQMGLAVVFLLFQFFCLQQILHRMHGSAAVKVCIGECSFFAYSGFLSIFCLLLPVQALKITGYFKLCPFVPWLSTAGCQLERKGGEVSGPRREF